jgi:hypothetical protein
MARILELQADAGIFIEIDDSRAQGTQRIAVDAGERALEKVSGSLDGAMANIQKVAGKLYESLAGLPRSPESAKFEFAVKLTGGAGIIIASGTAEANIKVTLEWKPPGGPSTKDKDEGRPEIESPGLDQR